jgi:hypothetical protein
MHDFWNDHDQEKQEIEIVQFMKVRNHFYFFLCFSGMLDAPGLACRIACGRLGKPCLCGNMGTYLLWLPALQPDCACNKWHEVHSGIEHDCVSFDELVSFIERSIKSCVQCIAHLYDSARNYLLFLLFQYHGNFLACRTRLWWARCCATWQSRRRSPPSSAGSPSRPLPSAPAARRAGVAAGSLQLKFVKLFERVHAAAGGHECPLRC